MAWYCTGTNETGVARAEAYLNGTGAASTEAYSSGTGAVWAETNHTETRAMWAVTCRGAKCTGGQSQELGAYEGGPLSSAFDSQATASSGQQVEGARPFLVVINVFRRVAYSFCWGWWCREANKAWEYDFSWKY